MPLSRRVTTWMRIGLLGLVATATFAPAETPADGSSSAAAQAPESAPPQRAKRRARAQTRRASTLRDAQLALLDHPSRPPQDRERDASARPLEVFRWLGVGPGSRVVDLRPGDGYAVHLLSLLVGTGGSVVAVTGPAPAAAPAGREADSGIEKLRRRIAEAPLANVRLVERVEDLGAGGADVLYFAEFETVAGGAATAGPHDPAAPGAGMAASLVAGAVRGLKAGGVLGVSGPGATEDARRAVEAAGFELLARSDMLRRGLPPAVPGRFLMMFRRRPAVPPARP